VAAAIRTDLILSAEIMAIALATVSDRPLAIQAGALVLVGVLITIAVYGVVGLIVKMDDIGLHMARREGALTRGAGRMLVKAMPVTMSWLTIIGTAAMLWVGGGILVHGLEEFDLTPVPHWVEGFSHWAAGVPAVGAAMGWTAFAIGSAVVGFVVGLVLVGVMHVLPKRKGD
jgi:predicted DNA repair protein MutK